MQKTTATAEHLELDYTCNTDISVPSEHSKDVCN